VICGRWPPRQRQLAGIQAGRGDLDQGIGAALHGRTLVSPTGSRAAPERVLEGGASFGIEMAVEIVTAIPGLGEPHQRRAVVLLLLPASSSGSARGAGAGPQKEVARLHAVASRSVQCLGIRGGAAPSTTAATVRGHGDACSGSSGRRGSERRRRVREVLELRARRTWP